ncbi:TlpA family protein disulfide reductase [Mucilaginibacter sp. FT3.2]|uniref:TlpA family protein disulfide reductase n=1 Tax=Mucilaginibacter sp. FT3.2 TaxID=2723090 RepID=UPI00161C96D3|nr:TlpA disulfide reductase family protein [Mucilaginibacter sp. FT3.2]MBB6234832.1 thiol-disulfide isomerase/thioredoxin [Mucilaginibacter sp. FT3.2]
MKKPAFIICLTLFFFNAIAQKIINKPAFTAFNVEGFAVSKVTLSDTATQISFETSYPSDTWFKMPSNLYLINGSQKLKVRSAIGIPFDKNTLLKGGNATFAINFAPIDAKTQKIDLIESDCQQCFKIYDLELPRFTLPTSITGDWFTTDGSKQWILGLYGNQAIYQNKLWTYTSVKQQGKTTVIGLKSGAKLTSLTIKQGNTGTLYLGNNKNNKRLLCSTPQNKNHLAADSSGFNLAQVYKGDSVEYSGFIKGYSPYLGFNSGNVFVNNLITEGQDNYLINIAADGSFKVRFPINNARQSYISFPFSYSGVYFEAGKRVFQKFDISGSPATSIFMGDNASLNSDLYATKSILLNIDWDKVFTDILNFTPEQYKAYAINMRDEELAALNEYKLKNGMSEKAFQLTSLNIQYAVAYFMLNYNSYKWSAYRKSKNIAPQNRRSELPEVKLDSAYLSFLKNIRLNDPVAVISSEYIPFTNNLKHHEIITNAEKQYVLDKLAQQRKQDTSAADIQFTDKLIADTKAGSIVQLGGEQQNIRTKVLKKMIGTNITFDLQIMDAQDTASVVERDFVPLSDKRLAALRSKFTNPYVFNLLMQYNNSIKNKIILNNREKDYRLNTTPATQADNIFSSIISKYKGKTIYVDFWATWCGPCIQAIQEIAHLKNELKNNKDVIFVYITNQTSPIGTYNGMIPGIKGEHYRVTGDEWNKLTAQFNITGIPHYVLVKNGIINNLKYQHFNNNELKEKLLGD